MANKNNKENIFQRLGKAIISNFGIKILAVVMAVAVFVVINFIA